MLVSLRCGDRRDCARGRATGPPASDDACFDPNRGAHRHSATFYHPDLRHAFAADIAERADEIAKASSEILAGRADLASVSGALARFAAVLATATGAVPRAPSAAAQGTADAAAQPAKPEPVPPRPARVEEVQGRGITIRFDGKRCIHARFCLLQTPTVFKANTPGTWIYPDPIDAECLVGVAEQCQSGAITMCATTATQRRSRRQSVVRIREKGPYAVHAEIDLAG